MKTILIFVTSLDGKITRWGDRDVRLWSSADDQQYFDSVWKDSHVIIMGRETYTSSPVHAGSNHIFIVMTRHPEKYTDKNVPGKLEFTNEDPLSLIRRFEDNGEQAVLVVGGSEIATLFLREKLISEIWLTIEPKIFGTGGSFVTEDKIDIDLKLLSCDRLNEKGTLVLKYGVEHGAQGAEHGAQGTGHRAQGEHRA